MMNIADVISELYIAESLALRVQKLEGMKGEQVALYKDILDVFVYDAAQKIRGFALDCVYSLPEQADANRLAAAINTLTTVAGVNVKEARRRIAAKLIEDNEYKF
jgi:hypothetical protein